MHHYTLELYPVCYVHEQSWLAGWGPSCGEGGEEGEGQAQLQFVGGGDVHQGCRPAAVAPHQTGQRDRFAGQLCGVLSAFEHGHALFTMM